MKLPTRLAYLLPLALVLGQAARASNLVMNPGFELGTSSSNAPLDWTFTPASFGTDAGLFGTPHSGTTAYSFGATGGIDDTISQSLTTLSGEEYQITYWLETDHGDMNSPGTGENFVATFGGTTLQNLDPVSNFAYTEFTFDAEATSTSSLLSFGGKSTNGFYYLDDIDVEDIGPGAVIPPAGAPDQGVGLTMIAATLLGLCALSTDRLRRQLT